MSEEQANPPDSGSKSSPRTCPSCEKRVAKSATFCPYCGVNIAETEAKLKAEAERKAQAEVREKARAEAREKAAAERKAKAEAKKAAAESGERQTPAWLWPVVAVAALAVIGLCVFVLLSGAAFLVFGRSGAPGGEVGVIDETTVALDESGGNAQLGELAVYVKSGMVGPEGAELTVTKVQPRSLSRDARPPADTAVGVYAVDWEPGAQVGTEPVELVFSYSRVPDGAGERDMAIYRFDGDEWLQLPSETDLDANTVSVEVSHFCLFTIMERGFRYAASRIAPDTTVADVRVHGNVQTEVGYHQGDPEALTIPASGLRFALIDTDAGILHEGTLGPEGEFDFILPAGTDVALDIDALIRVYADAPEFGRVMNAAPPVGWTWYWDSEVSSQGLSTGEVYFGTLLIPTEDDLQGAFNILARTASGWGYSLVSGYPPAPVTVVWAGTAKGKFPDTGYDETDGVLYVSNNPQGAWDEDAVLRAYGQYVHHEVLLGGESLFCDGQPRGPYKRSNPCQAWQEGFSFFFSGAVRDQSTVDQREESRVKVIHLEEFTSGIPMGPKSAGAVMQVLWDMLDDQNDGEAVQVAAEDIFRLMADYGTQIDSITAFYDFWITEYPGYADDAEFCQLFADYEIVGMEDCQGLSRVAASEGEPAGEGESAGASGPAPEGRVYDIAYGVASGGTLVSGQEKDWWIFEGRKGDVVTITVQAVDEGLGPSVGLWREHQGGHQAMDTGHEPNKCIEAFTLPADDTYKIGIWPHMGEGDYTISLELVSGEAPVAEAPTEPPPPTPPPTSTPRPEPTATPEPESSDDVRTISYGDQVSGHLTADNPEGDIYRFQGSAGDVVTIIMSSDGELDAMVSLRVESGDRLLTYDYRSGSGGHDGVIWEYELPEDGAYLIVAGAGGLASGAGRTGDYDLSLALVGAADGEPEPEPEPDEEEPPDGEGLCTLGIKHDDACEEHCADQGYDDGFCFDGECECCSDSYCEDACGELGLGFNAGYCTGAETPGAPGCTCLIE